MQGWEPQVLSLQETPQSPPLPADSPFPEHPVSSETKAKNAEGPLGHVTASGWAPGITTGMSGSWRVARTCPCGCLWGVGGGKEWALSWEPPWAVLSPTKRMVDPSTPQPSFCIRKLFRLSLPGMGQEPGLKCQYAPLASLLSLLKCGETEAQVMVYLYLLLESS